jgi:DivIVA domain-containing protein
MTAADVREVTFRRNGRYGYRAGDVREFLARVASELEARDQQEAQLRRQLGMVADENMRIKDALTRWQHQQNQAALYRLYNETTE